MQYFEFRPQAARRPPSRGMIRKKVRASMLPSFLPDGRHFVCFATSNEKEKISVYLGSLDGGLSRKLLSDESNAVYATSANTSGGYLLFGREGALMAQPFDAEALQFGGEAFPVAGRVAAILSATTNFLHRNFSVSENGVLVLDSQPNRQRSQVVWVDRNGAKICSPGGHGECRHSQVSA